MIYLAGPRPLLHCTPGTRLDRVREALESDLSPVEKKQTVKVTSSHRKYANQDVQSVGSNCN